MGIKQIEKNGKITFQVTVELKSKADPSIRIQKKKVGLKSEVEAKRWERKLKDQIQMKIYHREQTGGVWGQLVPLWIEALNNGTGTNRPVGASTTENYSQILRDYTKKWWRIPAAEITSTPSKKFFPINLIHLHNQNFS